MMPQQINPNQSSEITAIVGSYGVPFNGIMMNRVTAQHYAQQMLGTTTTLNLYPSHRKFKIIACYLEDLDGPNVGQIVAVCKPLQGVGPTEVK